MLRSGYGSSAPQLGMAKYYQSRASSDERRLEHELKLNEEKLSLEKGKFEREEKKDEIESKRFQVEENKALITAYSDIAKLNFKTMQMRKKMKAETNMTDEDISKVLLLLEYPPRPLWN
jgi:cell division protein FtsL